MIYKLNGIELLQGAISVVSYTTLSFVGLFAQVQTPNISLQGEASTINVVVTVLLGFGLTFLNDLLKEKREKRKEAREYKRKKEELERQKNAAQ